MSATPTRPYAAHGCIFFNEYMMADPDVTEEVRGRIYRELFFNGSTAGEPESLTVSRGDLINLMRAAECYAHYATHPAGNAPINQQLRELRAFVRERA